MGIKLGPIDDDERIWRLVPQECDGLTEEYESCSCIRECDNYRSNCKHDRHSVVGALRDDGDDETDWD